MLLLNLDRIVVDWGCLTGLVRLVNYVLRTLLSCLERIFILVMLKLVKFRLTLIASNARRLSSNGLTHVIWCRISNRSIIGLDLCRSRKIPIVLGRCVTIILLEVLLHGSGLLLVHPNYRRSWVMRIRRKCRLDVSSIIVMRRCQPTFLLLLGFLLLLLSLLTNLMLVWSESCLIVALTEALLVQVLALKVWWVTSVVIRRPMDWDLPWF